MILNLTQHAATTDQIAAGVVDLPTELHNQIRVLSTFEDLPSYDLLEERARAVVEVAISSQPDIERAMIGGAPFFMSFLEKELWRAGIESLYAFSKRVVTESPDPTDPTRTVKISKFKHLGFVSGV